MQNSIWGINGCQNIIKTIWVKLWKLVFYLTFEICKYISSYLFLRGGFVIKMNRRVSYARWYREIFHSIKRSQWISQQTSCIFNISKNYLLGLEKGENNSALVWVELSWGWAWQYALYSTINRFVIVIRTKVHLYSP